MFFERTGSKAHEGMSISSRFLRTTVMHAEYKDTRHR